MIHVEGADARNIIPLYSPHVQAFLLDSGCSGAPVPELGGTGRADDCDVSGRFVGASDRPVFLTGGLSAANVADAIRKVRPFGLNLCSGIRTDGRLDAAKLAAFVEAVERTDAALADARTVSNRGSAG